jgi:hypothetical protein
MSRNIEGKVVVIPGTSGGLGESAVRHRVFPSTQHDRQPRRMPPVARLREVRLG